MSDDTFAELLRSPLEPDPTEPPRRLPTWLIGALAMIVGVLGGLMAASMASSDSAAVPADTTMAPAASTATTGAPMQTVQGGFVEDFVDIGRGLGLRPMLLVRYPEMDRLVVATAVRTDLVPTETEPFSGIGWSRISEGVAPPTEYQRTVVSRTAPGMISIDFRPSTDDEDLGTATVSWASELTVRSGCYGCGHSSTDEMVVDEAIDAVVPYTSDQERRIEVGSGITLVVERMELAAEQGVIWWRIEGPEEIRVQVDPIVEFVGTDDPRTSAEDPTRLVAEQWSRDALFFDAHEPFARSGTTRLVRVREPVGGANQPTSLRISWDVAWQAPVGAASVLPLDGVPVVDLRTG